MVGPPVPLTAFEDRLLSEVPDTDLAELLRSRGLPGRRTETWKWSDLRTALREDRPASGAYAGADPEPLIGFQNAVTLTIRNGEHAGGAGLGAGLTMHEGAPRPAVVPDADLASLATAAKTVTIEAEGDASPLIVRRLSDGEGRHADRLRVHVGKGARLTLIETHEATGAPFANSLTEILVEDGGSLERIVLQPRADDAVIVHTSLVEIAQGTEGAFGQFTLGLGAGLARHETRLTHEGASRARLDGLYRLSGRLHSDITSHVTHKGEGAETRQLVKGIGGERARGVFQGKFLVERGAQRTDAKMAHHALLLSKGAQINAKPELEIYADDVECAHGNTAGALDTEALFYMRQRGVPEEEARSLLIDAFAAEVLDRIENEDLRSRIAELFHGGS